jgi:tetratricopeptide (TPR) repeat protein
MALLTVPTAAATAVHGDFATVGAITVGASGNLTFHLQALFANGSDPANLNAPLLHVTVYEQRLAVVDGGGLLAPQTVQIPPLGQRSFDLHDATLALTSGREGFTGLYPAASGTATLQPPVPVAVRPSIASTIPDNGQGTDTPDHPFYHVQASGPHFDIKSPGSVTYSGAGALKLVGPHVTITARENVTDYDTGRERTSATEETLRWVYVEWAQGNLDLQASTPVQIAAMDAATFTADSLSFTPTAGSLQATEATYAAEPSQAVTITGRFAGDLVTDDGSASRVQVDGNLQTTSMHAVPLPPVPGPMRSSYALWFGLVLVGLVAAGGVVAVLKRRELRPNAPGVSAWQREVAEEYAMRGTELADCTDWNAAAELMESAGRVDPTRPDYPLHEGIYRHEAGDHEGAIRAFDRASMLTRDGEPEWWAAKAALALQNAALAEQYVMRALDREPSAWVVTELEQDARLMGILDLPHVRAALAEARARLERDLP